MLFTIAASSGSWATRFRYNFSIDQLSDAFRTIGTTDQLPDPLKTVVHETTHLFHTIATPFGFLIYALRRLQASLVAQTINRLRLRHQIKVRYPLIDFVMQLPRGIQADVSFLIRRWYESELFILMALGDIDTWHRQVTRNPILLGFPNPEFFGRIQEYLALHYRGQARELAQLSGQSAEEALLPFASFESDQPEVVESEIDFMFLGQMIMGEANMIAVTESAAVVAEYWGVERMTCNELVDELHGKFEVARTREARTAAFAIGRFSELFHPYRTRRGE
jgi:hypothetical protein